MEAITKQILSWLIQSDSPALDPYGFASCAIIMDCNRVCRINQEVRTINNWANEFTWPDERWIVGEDGAGNYFVVTKGDIFGAVDLFDHEWLRFEPEKASLREFFEYCLAIEAAGKKG